MVQEELQAIVVAAGLTSSKTGYNQVLTALQTLLSPGRLLNVRIFTGNGVYTPTLGTKSIIVEAVGGGGGSGGVGATSASSTGVSSAGSTGAYARAYITSGFSSVAVTIGAAGVGGSSAPGPGGNGGTTSFGALLSCPGGPGGPTGAVSTGVTNTATGGYASSPSGTGVISTSVGSLPSNAIQVTAGYATGTVAAPSSMPGTTRGQGGNGMYNGLSQAATAGTAGQAGLVIVYEYA